MLLLTPGPTPVPPEVMDAMRRPMVHHRGPHFARTMDACHAGLQRLLRTTHPVLILPGTGTTAVEAALASLIHPGDVVATFSSGKFGERWAECSGRLTRWIGAEHVAVQRAWGRSIEVEDVVETLERRPGVSVICLVHVETSAAALTDVRAIATEVRRRAPETIMIVDGVTSVGAIPVGLEAWEIDALGFASQKALMCPPGLGFVGVGPRAEARLRARGADAPLPPLTMDLAKHLAAWRNGGSAFTAPVSLLHGLEAALEIIEVEGLEARHRRVRELAEATRAAARAMGLALLPDRPADSLTAMKLEGAAKALAECERRGVVLAGGQQEWSGRLVRLSHMGAIGRAETIAGVETLAAAIRETREASRSVDVDAGVRVIREWLG